MDAITLSTQIDPLTGLPMVFDNIIQQIPLGVQTTPWADLEATARPTTPELYPDNHFTVGAFLSAQNQDDKSAQTVMTNGDHDLRVHVTNAASGGADPIPRNALESNNFYGNTGTGPSVTFSSVFHMATKLYGFYLGFIYMQAAVNDVSPLRITLEEPSTLDDIRLFTGFAHMYNGTTFVPVAINETVLFPEPVDVSDVNGGNSASYDLIVECSAIVFSISMKLLAI